MMAVVERVWRAVKGHVPTRESIEANRWMRPVAHLVLRSELWRFNRRSVPRGVALGIFIGVAIPFAHTIIAPALAFLVGANVPAAFVATWISNPFTWAVMWPLALKIGRFMLHSDAFAEARPLADAAAGADADTLGRAAGAHPALHALEAAHGHAHILHRLAHGGLAFACGLVVEAVVLAALGYVLTGFAWRLWITHKRRQRLRGGAPRTAG